MSKKCEVELNEAGIQEMLKSGEMQSVLDMYGRDLGVLYDHVKVYKKRAVIHPDKQGDKRSNDRGKN